MEPNCKQSFSAARQHLDKTKTWCAVAEKRSAVAVQKVLSARDGAVWRVRFHRVSCAGRTLPAPGYRRRIQPIGLWNLLFPMARNPDVPGSVMSPVAWMPDSFGSRRGDPRAPHPNPVSLPRPISWHPGVGRTRGGAQDLLGRGRRGFHDHRWGRRTRDCSSGNDVSLVM